MMSVVSLPARSEVTVDGAVASLLDSPRLAARTAATYRDSLRRFADDVGGDTPIAGLGIEDVEAHLAGRYAERSPAYYNRARAALSALFAHASKRGWVASNPAAATDRRRVPRTGDRTIARTDLEALWSDPAIPLRVRTLTVMLYETAARASEVLALNVEDLDLGERSATIIGKGGDQQQIFWATTTARLLARMLDGRESGPVFVGDRRPTRPQPARDLTPDGYGRLSYRRAEELAKQHGGFTLHQLRHSALTHLAEQGVDIALLKAKSRHASLRSLEVYVQPGAEAVRRLTEAHDLAARR